MNRVYFIILVTVLFFSGCKDNQTVNPEQSGRLERKGKNFLLHTGFGNVEYDPNYVTSAFIEKPDPLAPTVLYGFNCKGTIHDYVLCFMQGGDMWFCMSHEGDFGLTGLVQDKIDLKDKTGYQYKIQTADDSLIIHFDIH